MNNSMIMMEEVRKPGVPSTLETQLGCIAEGIQQLADVCKSQQDMVQYLLGLSPGSHLENRSNTVQNDSLPEISERSFDIMAKEHRIRVVVGHDEEGNEIIKRLSATDELKLADKVIEAVVKSGRIKDFIDQEIEYGPHEKQAQEEAAQPPVVKTKFSDYIVQWRRIFKTGNKYYLAILDSVILWLWCASVGSNSICISCKRVFKFYSYNIVTNCI